jgi:hypothetical protein
MFSVWIPRSILLISAMFAAPAYSDDEQEWMRPLLDGQTESEPSDSKGNSNSGSENTSTGREGKKSSFSEACEGHSYDPGNFAQCQFAKAEAEKGLKAGLNRV